MIISFTFDHNTRLTQEDVDAMRPFLRGDTFPTATKPEDTYPWHQDFIGNVREVMRACPHLAKMIRLKGSELLPEAWEQVMERLRDIETKLEKVGPSERAFNERVAVHVPGLGLLLIQEVWAVTDCCTDDLRKHMDNGWRILAVCPQPDQRRPDYVLGRTTPET